MISFSEDDVKLLFKLIVLGKLVASLNVLLHRTEVCNACRRFCGNRFTAPHGLIPQSTMLITQEIVKIIVNSFLNLPSDYLVSNAILNKMKQQPLEDPTAREGEGLFSSKQQLW
ncbi:hypothetical protein NPIL_344491 [Nephila pilipes]|uniref:Uncharacterized protein n=1 Tax=Nephila pilipes TaxID=299642 RepID=A0A8X6NY35_NEPPI|nr:hypothetical protein NPIL_344491 [Nephila pilipes]